MNNREMASSYLKGAESRLEAAEHAFKSRDFPYVVRLSQECVELSLKAALRFVGIEPPKWHDVGIVLKRNIDRFPEWFSKEVDRLVFISRRLRREREPSMYGDEELRLAPHELYGAYDAERSLEDATFVYELCKRVIV